MAARGAAGTGQYEKLTGQHGPVRPVLPPGLLRLKVPALSGYGTATDTPFRWCHCRYNSSTWPTLLGRPSATLSLLLVVLNPVSLGVAWCLISSPPGSLHLSVVGCVWATLIFQSGSHNSMASRQYRSKAVTIDKGANYKDLGDNVTLKREETELRDP